MKILFVCTGNTCRSPMAEGIFNKLARDDEDISCSSAGMSILGGSPASENSVAVCKEIGIDISGHRSKSIQRSDIEKYDIFAVMTNAHALSLISAGVPREKIFVMGISDPFGRDIEVYRRCRAEIEKSCMQLYEKVKGRQ